MPALKEALSQLTISSVEVVSDHAGNRVANLEALFLEKGFLSITDPERFARAESCTCYDLCCFPDCEGYGGCGGNCLRPN